MTLATIRANKQMPSAVGAQKEIYRRNFERFCAEQLKVKTVKGPLVPLILNGCQRKQWQLIKESLDSGEPVRDIFLKPRQIGTSTLCEAVVFHRTTLFPFTNALVSAHDMDTSGIVFDMQYTFLDNIAKPFRPLIRSMKRGDKAQILYDVPLAIAKKARQQGQDIPRGLKSRIKISTANNLKIGRGQTLQVIHLCEVGSYEYGNMLKTAIYPAIHDVPGTIFMMEGTATGSGTFFHKMWKESKAGKNNFKPHFVAWFEHEDYQKSLKDGERLAYSPDEEMMIRHFHLTPAQVNWRRHKLRDYEGDEDLFRENYPMDDEEAWRSHGNSAFSRLHLRELKDTYMKPPLGVGKLIEGDGGKLKFVVDPTSKLAIWEHPTSEDLYYAGVDVSWSQRGDLSVIQVVKKYSYEQVAEWAGWIDQIDLAAEADKLGRYYNIAQTAVEVNGKGVLTLNALMDRFNYPNIYFRRQLDQTIKTHVKRAGWKTDANKKDMITFCSHMIRKKRCPVHSIKLYEALEHFVEVEGTARALVGHEDDRVMAWMIAMLIAYQEDENYEQDYYIEPEAGLDASKLDPVNYDLQGLPGYEEYATVEPSDWLDY